jgi:hypothetical protein
LARAKGASIRSIATFQHRTDLCILVDKDSPMSRVADLRGKTVVVFVASPSPPFIDVYLKSGGLTRDDVKVDVVDAAALFGTYVAKRADGMMSTTGSALPIAEALRPSKCLLASDAGIAFLSYGLFAREDTIAAKGAAPRRPIEVEQRASICRALLADPQLLLMDELFGALEAMTRDDLNLELAQIWQDTRKILLFITHSIAEAVFLSDRVVMMSKSPGLIVDTIVIDLPRPRRLAVRDSAEFAAYVHRIRHHFAELEMTGCCAGCLQATMKRAMSLWCWRRPCCCGKPVSGCFIPRR